MAQGPDPNRHFETDRELTGDEIREGGGPGDPDSSRIGLSSWAIVAVALALVGALLILMY